MPGQSYGMLLRSFRKNRRQRLSDVANLANIDVSYLSRIERGGRAIPSAQVQDAIASALVLTPDERRQLDQADQVLDLRSILSIGPNRGQVIIMVVNAKDATRLLGADIFNLASPLTTIYKKENAM